MKSCSDCLGRLHGAPLLLGLLLEDAQGRQVVLDLLEGRQRGLAVGGHGRVVAARAASDVARRRPPSKIVCAIDAPTAHSRLDAFSQFPNDVPSKPTEAFSIRVGK